MPNNPQKSYLIETPDCKAPVWFGTLQLQKRIHGFLQRTTLKVNNIISENKIHLAAWDQLQQDTKQGEKLKMPCLQGYLLFIHHCA